MTSDKNGGIGVFDSGVGGLTVVRRIWETLPNEHVVFVADQAHVPYGERTLEEVAGFARGISNALLHTADAKAIVMACNISTATALEPVRFANPDHPIFGVISAGASAALEASTTLSVGVLATLGTVTTGAYTRTLRTMCEAVRVEEVACPNFVPLIESEKTDSPEALDAAIRYLAPIISAGADVVILGCTHYPFLLPILRRAAPDIAFIDPAKHTVCELAQTLKPRDVCINDLKRAPHRLYTTGNPELFAQQISFFLPHCSVPIEVKQAWWRKGLLILNTD